MNGPFAHAVSRDTATALPAAGHSAALVTASYIPDLERCMLLCETVDRHVTGFDHHYILVEGRDVAAFKALQGPRRTIVDERDLLPKWLRAFDDPLSGFRRRIWLGWRSRPLRGWHVQQLRRIAIAGHATSDALVYIDSDVAFLKPFDCSAFWRDGKLRLFRRDDALADLTSTDHQTWSRNAGHVLGIQHPLVSTHDYISTLIAWDRQAVLSMCAHIECVCKTDWVAAIAARRKFSECMIYGRFVDEVQKGAGHFDDPSEFCRVHWSGSPMGDAEFEAFVDAMSPEQVAIGMQSFIGTNLDRIRKLATPA